MKLDEASRAAAEKALADAGLSDWIRIIDFGSVMFSAEKDTAFVEAVVTIPAPRPEDNLNRTGILSLRRKRLLQADGRGRP